MHASPQFLFQGPQLSLQPLAHRLSQDREVPLPGPSANVREAQEVERLRLAFATLAPILFRKAAKFDDPRLVGMQLKAKVRESVAQLRQEPLCFIPVLESCHEVSRPGEFHPQALAEPYVNVSAHTAPSIRPPGRWPNRCQWANNLGSRPATSTSQCAARRWCRRSRLYFRMAQRTRRSLK